MYHIPLDIQNIIEKKKEINQNIPLRQNSSKIY